MIVLVELWWVLKLHRATGAELRQTVQDLLDTRQFVLEQRGAVIQAVKRLDAAGDIADSLIVESARAAGCERVVTFDKDAGRVGMELLK